MVNKMLKHFAFLFASILWTLTVVAGQRTQAPSLKCNLPTILNTLCENKGNTKLWFWDAASGKCEQRVATGSSCDGFRSRDECLNSCTCRQPLNTGSECPASTTAGGAKSPVTERWWFDAHNEQCKSLNFTGCGGNANSFLTLSECDKTCVPRRPIRSRFDLGTILKAQLDKVNNQARPVSRRAVHEQKITNISDDTEQAAADARSVVVDINVHERRRSPVKFDASQLHVNPPHKRVQVEI